MREKGLFRIVIAVLLVPLLLSVGTAEAKKKHKKPKSPPVTVVSATKSTSLDGQTVTVTATCPSGLLAVGGGFLTPAFFDSGSPTDLNIPYESRRSGDAAWQVSAAREDTNGPGPDLTVTANVDCRSAKLAAKKPAGKKATAAKKKRGKKLTITEVSVSATSAASTGAQATIPATCPPKTQALGGGFSSSPTPSLSGLLAYPFFWANYRNTPTSWTAAFANVGSTARTLTTFAYCAAGLKIAETSASAPLAGSSPTASSATATSPLCPGGKALLGGGFNNTPAAVGSAVAILTASGPVSGTWQVGAFNFSTSPGTLGSSSYCA
jgi:hypothetical protein